jgi:hypothetical protein
MARKGVWQVLRALRRGANNLESRDIERVAEAAGFIYHHTGKGHVIYIKKGFPPNLSIPQGRLKGKTALRLLSLIESSLYREKEEGSDDD